MKHLLMMNFLVRSCLRFRTPFKNCILKSLKNRAWKESTEADNEWDICWAEKETIQEILEHKHLGPNQKVNHFKNHYEVC